MFFLYNVSFYTRLTMFRNNFLFESNKNNNDAHDTSHTLYEKFHTKCLAVSYFMFTFVIEIKTKEQYNLKT